MKLPDLASQIEELDLAFGQAATKAVNVALTARNWLVGFCIVEYEHNGQDRAKYGASLTKELAKQIDRKGFSDRNLWLYRQFYQTYPQLGLSLCSQFTELFGRILQSPIALSIIGSESTDWKTVQAPSALFEQSDSFPRLVDKLPELQTPAEQLIAKLSFTHFSLLLPIEDPLKRTFYEIEAHQGNLVGART